MEVIRVEFRLVGGLSGTDELTELEAITKVFVVSQRIQNLEYKREKQMNKNNRFVQSNKKISSPHTNHYDSISACPVRGFN